MSEDKRTLSAVRPHGMEDALNFVVHTLCKMVHDFDFTTAREHQMQSFNSFRQLKHRQQRASCKLLVAGVLAAFAQVAYSGADIKIGDDASLSLGIGLRTSYVSAENGAPNGTSRSNDFQLDNVRIFLNGQYGKHLKATFNTERAGGAGAAGDGVRVMDAIGQFELNDMFNVWMGRMLPPSDRANLAGPFYTSAWSYPGVASNYPNYAVGRDNGAMIWGKPMGGRVVYSLGAFNGHNRQATLSNAGSSLLYAGRLSINFWDVEPPPAHYLGGTYFGSKDILTLGIAANHQSKGAGTLAAPGTLKIWNIDGLFEKKFAGGYVPTLEGAYYRYDLGGAIDCGSGEPGAIACPAGDNIGGQVAGKAYLLSAAFLFPQKVGWGQFQPFVRHQRYNRDLSNSTNKATDVGLHYIIKGPNAKISAVYTKMDDSRLAPAKTDSNQYTLGLQLQY